MQRTSGFYSVVAASVSECPLSHCPSCSAKEEQVGHPHLIAPIAFDANRTLLSDAVNRHFNSGTATSFGGIQWYQLKNKFKEPISGNIYGKCIFFAMA